jgi:hypothetical protein
MQAITRTKNWMVLLFIAILFIVSAMPVYAEDTGKNVEIRVKVSSGQMKTNGAASKIQPPFLSAGNVMVPLSVFTNTKGFGAKIQLKNNKIITLTYQKHTIVLTIGSKSAMIDGKKASLAAAPINKQGVTMVPLAIIVKSLGAKLTKDPATKEFVITGTISSSDNTGPGIDSDSGKSLIGDSYYKWSMNYPTGLVQDKQWSDGSWISFGDVKGDYYLAISIDEAEDILDSNDKRDLLMEFMNDDETKVDIKTISRASGSIERMVTKDKSGFYYEYRAIQANGYFYILMFGKNAKSPSELDAHAGLLDSFKPSYDSSNKSLKDLARIKDGKIAFENSDYGLKLQLPKEWSEDTEETYPYFYGPKNSSLWLHVNSITPGDTLEALIERKQQFYKDVTVEAFQKAPKTTAITWNGIPAILMEYSYSNDSKTWWSEYEIYAFKGNYKYYVNYTYKTENAEIDKDKIADILNIMLKGMTVDFSKVEKSFGEVPDDNDLSFNDFNTKVTKTSKKYGYSITVPKIWVRGSLDMESDVVHLQGVGMDFLINAEPGELAGYTEMVEEAYTEDGSMKIDSKTNVTFAGINAIKMDLSTSPEEIKQVHMTIYLLENKGQIYLVQGVLNNTFATDLNRKLLEDALNSFTFNN